MALKKIYIGSFGPALYEDTDGIDDADGDFAGETQQGFRTDGGGIFDGDFSVGGDLGVSGDASITGALSVTGAITFDGKLSVGTTDWGAGATGILVDGADYGWAAQFNARVNANLNGCCASGSYSSMALTANQTSHNSFIANWNELYIKTELVLTGSDNYASVWGNLEIGATVTSPGSDNFIAALYGSLVVGATLTNNTRVCGVYVDSKITSTGYSGSGRTSAFECAIGAGTRAWDYGLYIPDSTVTTGIDIGTCTTDIVLKNNNTIVNTSSGLITLDASLSIGTNELTAGSINRATGSLTLEIGGTAVLTVAAASITLAQSLVLPANGVIGVTDGNPQIIFDNANNWLEITGKVGIGTISITEALHVEDGVIKANNSGAVSNTKGFKVENAAANIEYMIIAGIPEVTSGGFSIYDKTNITNLLIIDSNKRVGILATSPAAQLHVDQSSTTAAIPVLTLDQGDVSEEMIGFISTIGVGNAIEAANGKALTATHYIKVTLPGSLTRYISVGTIA